jgi:hypothetical protein
MLYKIDSYFWVVLTEIQYTKKVYWRTVIVKITFYFLINLDKINSVLYF